MSHDEQNVVPTGWISRTGAEISELISKGASPRWQGFEYSNSGMLFVTSENVRDGYLDLSSPKFLPMAFHEKLARTKLRQDDILVNLVGGSIGRSCRVTRDLGPANVNQAVAVIRLRDSSSAQFVEYFLQAPATISSILGLQVDAARPNISLRNLREFRILFPPLAEQRAIAAALSDVDALIGALDRLITKKRDLKQAAMQQLLTGQTRLPGFSGSSADSPARAAEKAPRDWKSSTLGELSSLSSGTTPPRAFAERYYRNGTTSWVKTLDLNNGFIDRTEERVTEHALRETSLRVYPSGTVLVAMYGGLNQIGRTGLLRIQAAVNQALAAIRPNPAKICPEFLLATLNFRVDHWSSVASSSRKDPNITSQDIRKFNVVFPSIEEQSAIATVLTEIGSELSLLEQRRDKTRKLKEGMMQELLTGRVRLI